MVPYDFVHVDMPLTVAYYLYSILVHCTILYSTKIIVLHLIPSCIKPSNFLTAMEQHTGKRTLGKDLATSGWMMLAVREMRQQSLTAALMAGASMTVSMMMMLGSIATMTIHQVSIMKTELVVFSLIVQCYD